MRGYPRAREQGHIAEECLISSGYNASSGVAEQATDPGSGMGRHLRVLADCLGDAIPIVFFEPAAHAFVGPLRGPSGLRGGDRLRG